MTLSVLASLSDNIKRVKFSRLSNCMLLIGYVMLNNCYDLFITYSYEVDVDLCSVEYLRL